jgi:hypothetical protein
MAASLGASKLKNGGSWKGTAVQRGNRGLAIVKRRYQETSSNRLRRLRV